MMKRKVYTVGHADMEMDESDKTLTWRESGWCRGKWQFKWQENEQLMDSRETLSRIINVTYTRVNSSFAEESYKIIGVHNRVNLF